MHLFSRFRTADYAEHGVDATADYGVRYSGIHAVNRKQPCKIITKFWEFRKKNAIVEKSPQKVCDGTPYHDLPEPFYICKENIFKSKISEKKVKPFLYPYSILIISVLLGFTFIVSLLKPTARRL